MEDWLNEVNFGQSIRTGCRHTCKFRPFLWAVRTKVMTAVKCAIKVLRQSFVHISNSHYYKCGETFSVNEKTVWGALREGSSSGITHLLGGGGLFRNARLQVC